VTCFTGLVFFGVDRRRRLPPLLALCERRLAFDFEARPRLDFDAARPRLDFDAARLVLLLELLRVPDWRLDCAIGSSSGDLGVIEAG
jgi:hypothetical protein